MDATQLTKTADPAAARSSVEPLYYGRTLSTGESVMAHADGVANILRAIRNDPELISAAYLFSVPTLVQKPDEWIEKSFGENVAGLVRELGKMNDLSKRARSENQRIQCGGAAEALRRMFLAMSQDRASYCSNWQAACQTRAGLSLHRRRAQWNSVRKRSPFMRPWLIDSVFGRSSGSSKISRFALRIRPNITRLLLNSMSLVRNVWNSWLWR